MIINSISSWSKSYDFIADMFIHHPAYLYIHKAALCILWGGVGDEWWCEDPRASSCNSCALPSMSTEAVSSKSKKARKRARRAARKAAAAQVVPPLSVGLNPKHAQQQSSAMVNAPVQQVRTPSSNPNWNSSVPFVNGSQQWKGAYLPNFVEVN